MPRVKSRTVSFGSLSPSFIGASYFSLGRGKGDVGSKTTWDRLVILEEAANGDAP